MPGLPPRPALTRVSRVLHHLPAPLGARRSSVLSLAFMTCTAVACAPPPSPRMAAPRPPDGMPAVVTRSQDLIGRGALRATGELSLYDALLRVRADLFRARRAPEGPTGETLPAVYINDTYQGSLEVLQGFTTDVVRDVQVVRSLDTALRFGRAHPAGALIVRLQLR